MTRPMATLSDCMPIRMAGRDGIARQPCADRCEKNRRSSMQMGRAFSPLASHRMAPWAAPKAGWVRAVGPRYRLFLPASHLTTVSYGT